MDIFKIIQSKNFKAACGCHVGKKRKNNEDNFYFNGRYMESDNTGLKNILTERGELSEDFLKGDRFFAVFDGMGGGDYGEVASYTAAKTVKTFLDNKENINPSDITPSLIKMCKMANDKVFCTGVNLGVFRMGSTLVSLYFHAGQVWVCNLGDSRCYRMKDREMKQLSMDHTDAEFIKENKIIGRKPYLTQYLGIDPEEMIIEPYIHSYYVEKGDRFLLCSDGLTDMVSEQDICDMLVKYKDEEECVYHLILAALDGGGKDNITVVICQVG